jgi:hypothetical protein
MNRIESLLRRRRLYLAMMMCGLLAAAGCGEGTEDGPAPNDDEVVGTYALEDTEHTRNVEVFDNVKRLDDAAAQAVYIDGQTLYFPTSVAESLSQYEPGDIMATAAGEGLLRRVESVERRPSNIVVQTSSASLTDVFASGEIYVAAHAEPGVEVPESFVYEPMSGDLAKRRQPLEFDWDDSLFSWSEDFASDLNARIPTDRLVVDEASISADVGAEFYVDAGASVFPPSFELKTLRAGANGTANATLRVSVVSDDAFDFNETYYLASTDPADNPLVDLPEQSMDVAGLVRLTFGAEAYLDLHASVDGEIRATGEVQVNGNLSGGIERKNGVWQTYTDSGMSPSGSGPDFTGDKGFLAEAKLTTTVTADVSDTLKGSLVMHPAIVTATFLQDVDANSGECPNHFNVNVKGKVSGQLEALSVMGFDIGIMDSPSSWTLYDENYLMRDGQLEMAGVCDPNYEPPSFGDGARSPGMMCREDSDCNSGLACFRDNCVTEGPIRFSVAWFSDTDVDLQVTSPNGELIDWRRFAHGPRDGLVYDFPKCTGKCFGPPPYAENIYSEGPPIPGTYIIEVVHEKERAGSDFALLIEHDGRVTNEGGKLPAEGESVRFEYTVN